jgi:PilZ domain
VLKEGRVITLDNQSVINCMVRDLSATGARIKCGDPIAVPNAFRLQVGQELTMRPARVVWRRGEYVGLVFTGDAIPAPRGLQI